mmetsp:Transcript_22716/g.59882  ORF Transcript_22716/g.59882 Transcript_22716/m.59882 type:complete len:402 (-) Transcript_22716:278-1483(-)
MQPVLLLVVLAAVAGEVEDLDVHPIPLFYRYEHYLSPSECAEVIAEAEAHGWSAQLDSIGGFAGPSQDIYVFDRGVVPPHARNLFQLLEPVLPRLVNWVAARVGQLTADGDEAQAIPSAERQLSLAEVDLAGKAANHPLPTALLHTIDWIFIRKYSADPGSMRNHLVGHRDTNLFSVNVPLNVDFEGGHLWFSRAGETALEGYTLGTEQDEDPLASGETKARSQARAKNSSAHYVPWCEPGTALLHDHRVLHGISPTTRGSKYSLLFFLDMPNLASSGSDDSVTVVFENSAHSRCPPVTVRWCGSPDFDVEAGIPVEERVVVEGDLTAGQRASIGSFEGHEFEVVLLDAPLAPPVAKFKVLGREEYGGGPRQVFTLRQDVMDQYFQDHDLNEGRVGEHSEL